MSTMSTVALKNHTNTDGTKSNKVSPNTIFAPLLLERFLASVGGQLVEINFKSSDKINIIFQFTAGQDMPAAFAAAIDQYNSIISNKEIISTLTTASLLSHSIVKDQAVETTDEVLNAMQYLKVNKSSVKGEDRCEAEIAYKKVLAAAPAAKTAAPVAIAAPKEASKPSSSPQSQSQSQSQSTPLQLNKQPSAAQAHTNLIADHIFTALFDTRSEIDFNVLQSVYQSQQELCHLQHRLSLAKNKDKAQIQQEIDTINAKIQPHLAAYNTLHKSIQNAVAQDVVVVTNHGYTKGVASVKPFPTRK